MYTFALNKNRNYDQNIFKNVWACLAWKRVKFQFIKKSCCLLALTGSELLWEAIFFYFQLWELFELVNLKQWRQRAELPLHNSCQQLQEWSCWSQECHLCRRFPQKTKPKNLERIKMLWNSFLSDQNELVIYQL